MKFIKLNIGEIVATSGAKVFKKLTTEEPQDDSIVGTWVLNDVLIDFPNNVTPYYYPLDFSYISADGSEITANGISLCNSTGYGFHPNTMHFRKDSSAVYVYANGTWQFTSQGSSTVIITIKTEPTNSETIEIITPWLWTNGKKQ